MSNINSNTNENENHIVLDFLANEDTSLIDLSDDMLYLEGDELLELLLLAIIKYEERSHGTANDSSNDTNSMNFNENNYRFNSESVNERLEKSISMKVPNGSHSRNEKSQTINQSNSMISMKSSHENEYNHFENENKSIMHVNIVMKKSKLVEVNDLISSDIL